MMTWRWKTTRLIATADNAVASKEDSPVRIVLEFEGDKSKLSLADKSTFATGKLLSGRELPYATLMYIWSNKEPVGKIIPGPRTARIQAQYAFTSVQVDRIAAEEFHAEQGLPTAGAATDQGWPPPWQSAQGNLVQSLDTCRSLGESLRKWLSLVHCFSHTVDSVSWREYCPYCYAAQ